VFSTGCYYAVYIILHRDNVEAQNISGNVLRLILWYLPIVVEISVHLFNPYFVDHTAYSSKIIYEHACTLFTIIVGTGLDTVTGGLKYLIGTVGWDGQAVGWDICAVIVVVGEFSLYFEGNHEAFPYNNIRLLTWFFMHSVYLTCIMMTILGCAALLQYGNLLLTVKEIIHMAGTVVHVPPNFPLHSNDYPNPAKAFTKLGLNFEMFIDEINGVALSESDPHIRLLLLYQNLLIALAAAFRAFEAYPDPDDDLANCVRDFLLRKNATDSDGIEMLKLAGQLAYTRETPVIWFFAVAGGTLIMLAVLNAIKQWPQDKFRWARLISMFVLGSGFALLSLMDIGRNQPPPGSAIQDGVLGPLLPNVWRFAGSGWIVPIFALVLLFQMFVNLFLRWLASEIEHDSRAQKAVLPTTVQENVPSDREFAEAEMAVPRSHEADRVQQPIRRRRAKSM